MATCLIECHAVDVIVSLDIYSNDFIKQNILNDKCMALEQQFYHINSPGNSRLTFLFVFEMKYLSFNLHNNLKNFS